MYINSSGNVGIGTTTPDQKLSIYSAATPSLEFSLGAGVGNQWTEGIDTANGNAFEIASSSALGTNPRFVISGSGNVGIGTTGPGKTLDIVGTFRASQGGDFGIGYDLNATYIGSAGSGTGRNIYMSSTQTQITTGSGGGTLILDAQASAATTLYSATNYNLVLNPRGTGNLIINNGNVGIGTTNPLVKLSVVGTAGANDMFNVASSTGTSAMYINSSGNVGIGTTTPDQKLSIYSAATPSLEFSLGAGVGNQWTEGIDTANGNAFEIASSSALGTNPRFVISGSGNVGIGTTNPAYALDMAAGDVYGYNGTVMAQASTTLFNYFLGGAGTIGAAATGTKTLARGIWLLAHLTTGDYNTANGYDSLSNNTTGGSNTANGYDSLYNNTTGGNNTANGMYSLGNNTTGGNNTANSYASLLQQHHRRQQHRKRH